jgi:hypothetical protein
VSAYGNGDVGSAGVISTSSGGSGTATFTLRNSIIRHFGYRIVRQTNGAGTTANVSVSYSDFDFGGTVIDQNASGGSGSIASGPGLLVQDPLWADPSTGDFRLQAGSPAIDTGDPAGLLAGESDTDVLGAPRISNGRTDMGAVELQQPVSVVPAPDTTPPTFKTSKLPKKLTLKKLLAGVTFTVAPNEPSSIDATLRGSARSVKLAKTYNLTLAHRKLGVAAGRRRVTLKVRKKLLGKSRKFTLQLTLVATDAAGNARTLKRTIKVH